MKLSHFLLPAALLAGLTTPLLAQGRPPGPPPGAPAGAPPLPPLIAVLDKDHDGTISKFEIKRAARALAKLDENNDDQLTKDEYEPPRPDGAGRPPRDGDKKPDGAGAPQAPPPPPLVNALDADHDGIISEEEIENAPAALATLDKNEDGELTFAEIHPPRPEGEKGDRPDGPPPGGEKGDRPGPPPGQGGGRPPQR